MHNPTFPIKAIRERLPPKNVKQLMQFLGLVNYYRRFIQDFAKIALRLTDLLKPNVKFMWDAQCELAFEKLKQALVAYPILRLPNYKEPFVVYTDASGYAIGAILGQCVNGDDYVCSYASRSLTKHEINYSISEKECLAVIFAIKSFRVYLIGTEFKVVTDHSALAWLMSIKDPMGRLARWAIYLQMYNFTIVHRKGLNHGNVDALSRPVPINKLSFVKKSDTEEISSKYLDPQEDEALLHYVKNTCHIRGASNKQVKRVENLADHYKFDGETLLYRKELDTDDYKIVPKIEERQKLVWKAHLLGHFGQHITFNRLREKYY